MNESCDNCNKECPHIEQCIGEGVPFQRLRRITGYLVGDISRWNDGKLAELKDRSKNEVNQETQSIISK